MLVAVYIRQLTMGDTMADIYFVEGKAGFYHTRGTKGPPGAP